MFGTAQRASQVDMAREGPDLAAVNQQLHRRR